MSRTPTKSRYRCTHQRAKQLFDHLILTTTPPTQAWFEKTFPDAMEHIPELRKQYLRNPTGDCTRRCQRRTQWWALTHAQL